MARDALTEKGGFITPRDTKYVTVRLRIPAGVVTPQKLYGIAAIAEKYNAGIHLTTRQTIELSHVNPTDSKELMADLLSNGTPLGAERTEVVNVIACPGLDRCKFAQIDSVSIALAADKEHFGLDLPVKCRISVSSCPISCMREQFAEIGVTGVTVPYRIPGACTGCDNCVQHCLMHAIRMVNGKVEMNLELCSFCGLCVTSCPYGIITADAPVYRITIGGKGGKMPIPGRHLITVRSEESVQIVIREAVRWIERNAWSGSGVLGDQMDELDLTRLGTRILDNLSKEEIVE